MKIKKAYNIRLYPTNIIKCLFNKTFGSTRLIYNTMLQEIKSGNKRPTEVQLKSLYPFLKEVDSIALQQSRINLQKAFKNLREKRANYPKFKSKKFSRQSYRTISTNNNIKIDNNTQHLTLPKVGKVRFRDQRIIPENINQVTITRTTANNYYASILIEEEINPIIITEFNDTNTVGIDMGLVHFYTNSEGNTLENPRFYRKDEKKLAKIQRKLSKKKKGSKNRNRQRIKVAKVHEKITNKRKDFLQKNSTQIINEWDLIAIEDLNIKGMIQNLYLAKSFQDLAWSDFVRMLNYKSIWGGKTLYKVNRFYPSSKTCNICGNINMELRLKERVWVCPQCRHTHDRDINASLNIKKKALKSTVGITGIDACGDYVRPKHRTCGAGLRSLKQETHKIIRG